MDPTELGDILKLIHSHLWVASFFVVLEQITPAEKIIRVLL